MLRTIAGARRNERLHFDLTFGSVDDIVRDFVIRHESGPHEHVNTEALLRRHLRNQMT